MLYERHNYEVSALTDHAQGPCKYRLVIAFVLLDAEHTAADGRAATDYTRADPDKQVAAACSPKKSQKAKSQTVPAAMDVMSTRVAVVGSQRETSQLRGSSQNTNATGAGQAPERDSALAVAMTGPVVHPAGAVPASFAQPFRPRKEGTSAGSATADVALAGPGLSAGVHHANGGFMAGPQQLPSATGTVGQADRQLPATGTTPVKAFLPISLPRLDEIGKQERTAVVDLQVGHVSAVLPVALCELALSCYWRGPNPAWILLHAASTGGDARLVRRLEGELQRRGP
jgi:hypothetical protein